jgi:hypothetical protein
MYVKTPKRFHTRRGGFAFLGKHQGHVGCVEWKRQPRPFGEMETKYIFIALFGAGCKLVTKHIIIVLHFKCCERTRPYVGGVMTTLIIVRVLGGFQMICK